jgi:hypothetical protein
MLIHDKNFFYKNFSLTAAALLTFLSPVQAADQPQSPFVVVELFTSEGCSSCPPADNLLSQLIEQARRNNTRVFPLSFHVDYWNQLGWVDPFSHPYFSQRQRHYNSILGIATYTPQMIINGREAFTGSKENTANKFIEHYLTIQPAQTLDVLIKNDTHDYFDIAYMTPATSQRQVLHTALVERNLENQVTRGENAGRSLKHNNVVRSFISTPVTSNEGEIHLLKPKSWDPGQSSIIVYLQDMSTLEILNAQAIDLAP